MPEESTQRRRQASALIYKVHASEIWTVIGQLCKSDQYEDIPKQDFSRIEF